MENAREIVYGVRKSYKNTQFRVLHGIQNKLSLNVLENAMKIIFLFTALILYTLLPAQMPDWEKDFMFAESSSDTVYLAADEFLEDTYQVFHSKEELYQYFAGVNFDKTGEIINEYKVSVEEIPGRYIAKKELVEESYRNFCQSENKKFPDFFSVDDLENSDEAEKQKLLDYLTGIWGVPVNFYIRWADLPSPELIISETDWCKKEFLNKVNGLLSKAFQGKPPVNFSFNGIESGKHPTVSWEDFHHLEINRKTNELIVRIRSGEEMKFPYNEDQYSNLADFHVNFLAFCQMMLQ